MSENTYPKMYETYTLPSYVLNYFGGNRETTMEKIADGAWRFKGGGNEIVVQGETAGEARRRIRRFVKNIMNIDDRRVLRDN